MSGKASNSPKEKLRNILLIGSKEQTADFIQLFGKFWKHNDVGTEIKQASSGGSLKEIQTKNCFHMFDEQICFIDSPKSMNSSEARYFYKVLTKFKVIDAILVFTDDRLSQLQSCMQFYFSASNYPVEKVVFLVNSRVNTIERTYPNIMTIMIRLEQTLKKLRMNSDVSQNKNLFFLIRENFRSNEMLSFCYCLKDLFILQPCVFQLKSDVQNIFDNISFINSILIEILLSNKGYKIFVSNDRYTICKYCSSIKSNAPIVCHSRCQCLDDTEELYNCSEISNNRCGSCLCSIEKHISLKHRTTITFGDTEMRSEEIAELRDIERNSILHIVATLYLFCKQSNDLTEIYKNLKKEYWSLAALSDITIDNVIYKEVEDKINELESNSYEPTHEEVTVLLESLENCYWNSFQMKDIIKTKCELKIIANTNMPSAPNLPGTSRATHHNNQRPLRFPEMKSNTSHNPRGNSTKDEKDVMLENMRKELDELKVAINKEKSEKESMQKQIDDLKRKMENL